MEVEYYLKPSLNYHILSLHTQNFTRLPLQPSCSDSSFSQSIPALPGAQNGATAEQKGKEHATTMQKIKIWKHSQGSLVTIFSTHVYCFIGPTTALARWQRSL